MDKPFSPEDSLLLIRSMIDKTRMNLSENRFYFLFWGWVVFAALIAQFVLKALIAYEKHYLVWLVILPAVLVTLFYARRHDRQGPRTWVGDSMSYLWTGIGVSFFILSFLIARSKEGFYYAYPFFIMFYGLGTYISGRLLRFRPLVVGGILNWVLALVCGFVPYDYQMLLTAGAIFISYIIPGHLLNDSKTSAS